MICFALGLQDQVNPSYFLYMSVLDHSDLWNDALKIFLFLSSVQYKCANILSKALMTGGLDHSCLSLW